VNQGERTRAVEVFIAGCVSWNIDATKSQEVFWHQISILKQDTMSWTSYYWTT